MTDRQPMAGPRRGLVKDPMETSEFAARRRKNRVRNRMAKASRKANRGK